MTDKDRQDALLIQRDLLAQIEALKAERDSYRVDFNQNTLAQIVQALSLSVEALKAERDELRATVARRETAALKAIEDVYAENRALRTERDHLLLDLQTEKAAVCALDCERDELKAELKVAHEGWKCECSTDDACRFAKERDELKATLSKVYRQQAEGLDEASDVLEHVDKEREADRAAMRLALDALTYQGTMGPTRWQRRADAITALRGVLGEKT
jgi:hypothetical protein